MKIGDRGGGLLEESASSDWKATATNQMYSNDLEACGMKCCYFLFHSEVNFLCVHCPQVSDSGLLGLLFMEASNIPTSTADRKNIPVQVGQYI